jgi:hypothetical protein
MDINSLRDKCRLSSQTFHQEKKSVRDFIASTNPVQRCEGCRALYPRKPHMKLLQAASVRVVLQPGNQLAEEGGGGRT